MYKRLRYGNIKPTFLAPQRDSRTLGPATSKASWSLRNIVGIQKVDDARCPVSVYRWSWYLGIMLDIGMVIGLKWRVMIQFEEYGKQSDEGGSALKNGNITSINGLDCQDTSSEPQVQNIERPRKKKHHGGARVYSRYAVAGRIPTLSETR
ncbi:uncharacterized protein EI90DRAFT_3016365 [Cantharellus anzutake]|uniref:uncharacterized protein n=1 Tax=Cantharellus anzutake TaxID=1750568 RepID=UPI0019066F2C|nr:uncharacterized protein EI90DRAFT_3016365 [Cantharellus anzutake]KAF8331351.1 hypothetical protein EI90DRAFT_3016365 [Cantharellus anzutake]